MSLTCAPSILLGDHYDVRQLKLIFGAAIFSSDSTLEHLENKRFLGLTYYISFILHIQVAI